MQASLSERPLFAALVFCGLTVLWMGKSGLRPLDTISDVGDPLHLAYILAWNAHQLVTSPLHLFDANSFYPWSQSLAFADHLVPESVMVAPVFWATGNAVLGYNVAVFLGLFTSAWFMRWLILDATGNPKAALLAGLAYAFNGFTLVEANRVQVIHLQWWPVALVFLGRFVTAPHFKWAMALGGALALQSLSGSYYLAYSALIVPFWIGLAFAASRIRPTLRAARALALAAAISSIPVIVLIWPYLSRGLPTGRVSGGVDLVAYLRPAPESFLTPLLGAYPLGREFKGVLGLSLMAIGLIAIVKMGPCWSRTLGLIAAVTALMGVAFSLGDTMSVAGTSFGPGPQHFLLQYLPLEGLRHTPRFNALAVLGGAVLVGLGAARLLGRTKASAFALVTFGVFLPLEHWRPTGDGVTLPKSSALRAIYHDVPTGPLVDLPLFPMRQLRYWSAYPYLSTYHWNPVPIGRTSFYPPGHDFLAWLLSAFPDARSVSVLARLGIRTVVVHPRVWPENERQERLDRINDFPQLVLRPRPPAALTPNPLGLGDERHFDLVPGPMGPTPCVPSDEVKADVLRVLAMGETSEAGLAETLDRQPSTYWTSGRGQSGWYGFQVRLQSAQRLAAVAIETPPGRFPRVWPSLEWRAPGGAWAFMESEADFSPEVAWEILNNQLQGARSLRLVIRFPPREIRAFRVTFPAFTPPPASGFDIEEVRAYRDCR